jgi:hypothetical protein
VPQPRAEYFVISEQGHAQLTQVLNRMAGDGWKPILMTTVHAGNAAGIGNTVTTVILERPVGG